MPAAQNDYLLTQSAIMQCGVLLGDTADLYGTGLAADDLDAILSALGVARSTYTATPMEHSLARHILPPSRTAAPLLFLTARTGKGSESMVASGGTAMRYAFNTGVRARRRLFQPAGHCARPPDGSWCSKYAPAPSRESPKTADGVLHDDHRPREPRLSQHNRLTVLSGDAGDRPCRACDSGEWRLSATAAADRGK